jgi:transposase-like protein
MEQNGKGKWLRRSERERQAVMSRFERSGLGVEAFCQREGISAASFYRWRRMLGKALAGSAIARQDTVPALVDLGALRAGGRGLEVKLELGDGLVLHLVRS